jgi:hypothetical protein
MSADEQKPPKRQKTKTVPFSEVCELAGGEETLRRFPDPITGKPLFPPHWSTPRGRWYQWKSRGVPAHIAYAIVVQKLRDAAPNGSPRNPVQALARIMIASLTPPISGEITLSVKDGKIVKVHHSQAGDIEVVELFRAISE